MKARSLLLATLVAWTATPRLALAASSEISVLDVGVGAISLVLAVVLLIDVIALRKVADGAAIAENLAYVMFGVICLATSVLLGWLARFPPEGMSVEQVRLGSELLVLASMAFFAIYTFRLKQSLMRLLKALTTELDRATDSAGDTRAEGREG